MTKIIKNNSGILCVYKPYGYTSRDVVNIVCKCLSTKKIGHTGTLDPLATGVLVLGVNEGTKLIELITSYDKEYIARVRLGVLTDTLDTDGKILDTCDVLNITDNQIDDVLKSYIKSYEQEVPIYSAVKVNGKKLYEYARNNENIDLPKKFVTITKLDRISNITRNEKYIEFDIKCDVSKGTYIRSLIRDIASSLGVYGTMMSLERIRQGNYTIDDCYTLDQIENENYSFVSINDSLNKYKHVIVDENIYKKVINGAIIDNTYNDDVIVFTDKFCNVIAIYKIYDKDNSKLKPWKMFKNLA